MIGKLHITNGFKITMTVVILVSIIGFSERQNDHNVCLDIVIKIENQFENYFIDEEDILKLMTDNGEVAIQGINYDDLNLKRIEERVKNEKFIRKAEIYRDLKGNMMVNAELRRPFARFLKVSKPDEYLGLDGVLLPVSRKFVTRTIIVSGAWVDKFSMEEITASDEGQKIYDLLNYIYENKFWKAQIAQIEIDAKMNITMYPQVTKQVIEFGQPENIEEKFTKLKVFYKRILPQKGWNTYERVNLEYDKQIVAE